jgi:hypothetical protein
MLSWLHAHLAMYLQLLLLVVSVLLGRKSRNAKVWGEGLRDDDKRFEPAERLQSSDCYRAAATESVQAFCHSEEGSRLDTQSYRVFTMPNLETGLEACP